MSNRPDGRQPDELRPIQITRNHMANAEGSAFIQMGKTQIICTASVEERVPRFLYGKNSGWITAEYAMLPRATHTRTQRETSGTKGRTQEIQRLIGRSLRAIVDLKKLGERTLWIDCDVIQADGGTRTASISGAYVAISDAVAHLRKQGKIQENPLCTSVAAVSVGIINDQLMLDLCYTEDSSAEVDFNVVMTGQNKFIELQGTAEGEAFSQNQMIEMISLAKSGIHKVSTIQNEVLSKN